MSKQWTTFFIWFVGFCTGMGMNLFSKHPLLAAGAGVISMTASALIRESERTS